MAEIGNSTREKNAYPHDHVEYKHGLDSPNDVEGLGEPEEKARLH